MAVSNADANKQSDVIDLRTPEPEQDVIDLRAPEPEQDTKNDDEKKQIDNNNSNNNSNEINDNNNNINDGWDDGWNNKDDKPHCLPYYDAPHKSMYIYFYIYML